MKYFLDTEFIEDGKTIDLISIAIVSDSEASQTKDRTLYLQNLECDFSKASDWVWRNVFPHLTHFDMRGNRSCFEQSLTYDSGLGHSRMTRCGPECVWATRQEIMGAVLGFCSVQEFGEPEFWGYYADYDWVAFCQLFGSMIALPKGFPMYCRDIKQWCDLLGNPDLPKQGKDEHSALLDAQWNKKTWQFLDDIASGKQNPL
jgi:hypothetical protein